jgi:hypothetical protein
VQRDRAMLLHLQLAGAAVDTRQDRGIPAREGGRFGGQIEPAMLTDLQSLGGMQERVLARLADHVACVNEVITETHDRRLTEYRTARVVEELYMFARIWQSLERSHVMARLGVGHAVGDAARAAAFQELQVRANLLSQRIKEFTWWADNTIEALRAGRSERTATIGTGATPPGREPGRREPPLPHATIVVSAGGVPVLALPEGVPGQPAARGPSPPYRALDVRKDTPSSTHCDFRTTKVEAIEDVVNPVPVGRVRRLSVSGEDDLRRADAMFAEYGFTPYLVTFVAQALSAMGDHNAALRLLVGWQQDLAWLVQLAGSPDAMADRAGPSLVPRIRVALPPEAENVRRREARRLLLAAPWYRLTTFVDTIVLQELSENTDFAIVPTENGLRHLVVRLFPDVLAQVSQTNMLPDWRGGADRKCRRPSHAWMQSLVLSYATWVKNYLDKRNRNLVRPGDVSEQDVEFADMIAEIDQECYVDVLFDEQGARHRAHFAVTAAAIKLNRLVDSRYDADLREGLRLHLETLTRRAIFDLERIADHERAGVSSERARGPLERLIFHREDLALRTARTIKTRLDTLAGR